MTGFHSTGEDSSPATGDGAAAREVNLPSRKAPAVIPAVCKAFLRDSWVSVSLPLPIQYFGKELEGVDLCHIAHRAENFPKGPVLIFCRDIPVGGIDQSHLSQKKPIGPLFSHIDLYLISYHEITGDTPRT